jgi:hypothetical protein
MSDVILPTLIPIAVAVVGALVTVVYGPILKARRDRRRQAEDLEARYRDELMSCAWELQIRLYRISAESLLVFRDSLDSDAQAESQGYVYTSTLWMIGRYLAWVELLRRDRYFLALGTTSRGRELLAGVATVGAAFANDRLDRPFRLFRPQQSAIAELMIVERESRGEVRSDSLGYATFTSKLEHKSDLVFRRWFGPLGRDFEELTFLRGRSERIKEIQHALLDLVRFLDETGMASDYPRA